MRIYCGLLHRGRVINILWLVAHKSSGHFRAFSLCKQRIFPTRRYQANFLNLPPLELTEQMFFQGCMLSTSSDEQLP